MYDVPRLEGVCVDGNAADWEARGFRVEIMPDKELRIQSKADLDASFRLGWDERGLLVLIAVHDDVFVENPDEAALWDKDSVEVFAATKRGARDLYQLVVSPGVAPGFAELRAKPFDFRKTDPRALLTYEAARTASGSDYVAELLLPWANLDISPQEGGETGFQVYVNDADDVADRFQAAWYPQTRTHENARAMHRIRLARKPSPPDCVRMHGEYDDTAQTHVSVLTLAKFAGKSVRVEEGWRRRAGGVLRQVGDYARAELRFSMPARRESAKPWRVCVANVAELPLSLPGADIVREQQIMLLRVAAKPPVFKGDVFPECDFENPLLAERLIGLYRVEPTFYDRAFNPATTAGEPGRYGAVLEITPESGPAFRRYLTLFRAPDSFDTLFSWWYLDPRLSVRLPEALGLDPSVVAAQSESLGAYFKGKVLDDLFKGQEAAVLFAGLFEAEPGRPPATVVDDVWAVDRQWWVDLKRKLNGMDRYYPYSFVCPYQKEGAPAPVLREGTTADAGMKPDAVERIDAVCRAWSEESHEPFAVCLARHGVVFFHQAYGTRCGEPMTVDTKSWMASISKFLSGALMMTLVDQGLVDLDEPVDKYLPPLRGIPVDYPLTIRHLYTHTSGLGLGLQPPRMFPDHWGDERNDFEEIVARYYPCLEVGERSAYNGAGHALGGKIIESITGEALPQFFKRHLWGPLGCEHTGAMDGSARTMSVPLDIAKFGQMLLNRGAYGNKRFFSEATFEKMLPVKLAPYVRFDTNVEWGIGPTWARDPGLSKRTFGHGAASAATLRIDPDNDLVIVMTRNTAGPQWGKYYPQFIQAIVEGLAGEPHE